MKKPTPFTIQIPQAVLDDLAQRLAATRWTDEPENAEWQYGTNPAVLREIVEYWQTAYNWREQEALLNRLPQYKVEIDGFEIHFIYQKGSTPSARALLLTHGWPDSPFRFYKAIPMLTSAAPAFDVVAPSVPGFGFSSREAINSDRVAMLWSTLMTEVLGYDRFFAAGGDIGSVISKSLANQFPEQVEALHVTDIGYPSGEEDWSKMTAEEQKFGQYIQHWMQTEGAAYKPSIKHSKQGLSLYMAASS